MRKSASPDLFTDEKKWGKTQDFLQIFVAFLRKNCYDNGVLFFDDFREGEEARAGIKREDPGRGSCV
ncbi:MAG: hypothetical protein IJN07_01020 [Clostridia bacterium]|nr:hypothetical protein [Clostridia bacterium]